MLSNLIVVVVVILCAIIVVATVVTAKVENKSLATVFHSEVDDLRKYIEEIIAKKSAAEPPTPASNNAGKTTN